MISHAALCACLQGVSHVSKKTLGFYWVLFPALKALWPLPVRLGDRCFGRGASSDSKVENQIIFKFRKAVKACAIHRVMFYIDLIWYTHWLLLTEKTWHDCLLLSVVLGSLMCCEISRSVCLSLQGSRESKNDEKQEPSERARFKVWEEAVEHWSGTW